MQSEVPISKRHWSQAPPQTTAPTSPLIVDGSSESSAMKTIAESTDDQQDTSQDTSIHAGSDETDRLPPVLPHVNASPGGESPRFRDEVYEKERIDEKITSGDVTNLHEGMHPGDSRENGVSLDQEHQLASSELSEESMCAQEDATPEVEGLSVEDIPPPLILPEGYDNTSYVEDLQEGTSTSETCPDRKPVNATTSIADQKAPSTISHVLHLHAPKAPEVEERHQQIATAPDLNTDGTTLSSAKRDGTISANREEPQVLTTTLDIPESEGKISDDVPNGLAKMESRQQQSGYDNAAFTNDETLKDIERETEDSLHNSIQDPKIDTTLRDEKDPEVLSDGSPVPLRVPRRVSFSERPPQRAVYETAHVPGTPLDPAAAAVKEQGLGPSEKWRVLRNVTIISAAFMVLFTAFFGAANLQSSVNPSGGLGTVSLTAVYAALIVSNLFLPSVVIRRLGCKWTVALGMALFTPYAGAQLAASWASLVPTALLAGAAGAPMWCAKCSYLNAAAGAYSAVTGSPRDLVMVRFFGLFYVLFPLGHVWGNLITSEVLSTGTGEPAANASAAATIDVAAVCGANFCPAARSADENPNLARPPDHLITTIAALFIALSLLAAIMVAVGVDNLRRYGERLGESGGSDGHGGGDSGGGAGLLVATLRLLGDRNQLLLVPITAFIGISQAFLGADFTESYIACAWGIAYIGYVLMGYGLASSLASVVVSWAVKRAGRLPVVAASIVLFLVLVGVLRWWTPRPQQGAAFVLLAAAWGFADSTALVINAMYGLLFRGREAAAYSNFSLWGSAGFIVTYSYSPYLCAVTKLAILAVVLILSLAGFIMAERALRRILAAEEEAKKREENFSGSGISVISDKAHAA